MLRCENILNIISLGMFVNGPSLLYISSTSISVLFLLINNWCPISLKLYLKISLAGIIISVAHLYSFFLMTESKIGPRFSGMTDNNLASERKMIMNINDVNIKWPRPNAGGR